MTQLTAARARARLIQYEVVYILQLVIVSNNNEFFELTLRLTCACMRAVKLAITCS